ncbi:MULTISPECIES: hypothetical protein [Pseudomonas]|uniref:hypothetical protein n=1 Tax=Pseudomonas TaxID=286 RepID=UPI00123AD7A0|nr:MULTISPECIES: hypothetical protein [Pseudomonas]QIB50075.1 hypothetical protein G3M63_02755 [Pseudomonas sp. OIL-1]
MSRFDRDSVRLLAAKTGLEIVEWAKSGGNPHQKALDKQDELEALTTDWPEEERLGFQSMFDQEMEAWNEQQENKNVAALVEQNDFINVWGAVVGISIGLILLIIMFSASKG